MESWCYDNMCLRKMSRGDYNKMCLGESYLWRVTGWL